MPKTRPLQSRAVRSLKFTVFLLFGFLAFAPGLRAQPAERAVTLEEAYRLALENHEDIGVARENINQARTDLTKSVARILPNITAEGSYTRFTESKSSGTGFVTQPESSTAAELRLTQPLYSGGREWAVQRQAKLQIQSETKGLEGATESVMLDTGRAYYSVLKAQKDVEIKRAALKRAQERLEVADARLTVGEVTKSAVLRAQAELAGAEAELLRSLNNLDNSKVLLARLTGIDGAFNLVEPAPQGAVALVPERLIERALEERSDYTRLLLQEKAASESITIAKAGFKPSLRLEGLYSWRDQEPQTTFFQKESASGTLRLTYPIFEGFLRKAELTDARSEFREAELVRLGLKRDISVQVNEAVNNVKAIDSLIESFRRQVAFAEEDYNMVFEQFKFGVATTLDVIDADTVLVSAQTSFASATYDLEIAKLNLKFVTGTLVDGAAR
ncbi:MAG: TolC family protein [Deltaproteobacteria bacterium]|nr:TolC family protein [Deltaproteobacteria bacterium]